MWALLVLAPSCVLLLMAQPRALVGGRLPFLELDEVAARRVLATDGALLQGPAGLDPVAADLENLFLRDMVIQAEVAEDERSFRERRRALAAQLAELVAERGEAGALLLRARAVQRMEAAMAGRLPEDDIQPAMGAFANQLQRHKALKDGRELAPPFVVRSMFKARWNQIYGLPVDHALAPIEQQAVHGWLGLHSTALSTNARLRALKRYAAAGGPRASEAQGVLLVEARDFHVAVEALTRAQKSEGGLRVANYLLGARVSAGLSGDG